MMLLDGDCGCARVRESGQRMAGWSSLALTIILVAASSCAKSPTRPIPPPLLPAQMDIPQAWSHDGQWIAYRRVYASSDGAAGVYLIHPSGGKPRFVTAADLFYPALLQFSPDDKKLVGVAGPTLVVIDIATGTSSYPINTNSQILYPDWSPDGRTIAYHRVSFEPSDPPDSSGLHFLDVATGVDRPIVVGGEHINATYWAYAPDGRLACKRYIYPPGITEISVLDPTAKALTVVTHSDQFEDYSNLQWYWRPEIGRISIFFQNQFGSLRAWLVDPDGSNRRRFPPWLSGAYVVLSPDGRHVVIEGVEPRFYFGILDVVDTDDLSGATRRQLTTYEPPVALGPQ